MKEEFFINFEKLKKYCESTDAAETHTFWLVGDDGDYRSEVNHYDPVDSSCTQIIRHLKEFDDGRREVIYQSTSVVREN